MGNNGDKKDSQEERAAAIESISLSQALLAPLDAVFKAQIHAARSFLNLLLQMGYPHNPYGTDEVRPETDGTPYNQEFFYEIEAAGKKERYKVSIPTLALIPVAPLAVESASFKLEMRVDSVARHNQMQVSEKKALKKEEGYDETKRPWFLVSEPLSLRGSITAPAAAGFREVAEGGAIQIEIKVGKTPLPAGLEKLLTFMTQTGYSEKEGGETLPPQKTEPDKDKPKIQ